MKDTEIKRIKDKWLDDERLTEKEVALLFSRIEKLEDELQRKSEKEWNDTVREGSPIINARTVKCPNCHHLFEIYIIE